MSFYIDNYEVMVHDTDINNNAWPSNVSRYMQETANHQMRDHHPTYDELFNNGQSFIATRMAFEVKEQLHAYDKITVRTWHCDGKGATFIRGYDILRDGVEVVRGYSEWAVANLKTGKLCKTSEVDLSEYEHDEIRELTIPVKFRFPKEAEFQLCGTRHVDYEFVDKNLHMNNTFYQNMVWNCVPDVQHKKLTSFSLRFMAEAPLGADLEIYRSKAAEPVLDGCGGTETYYFKSIVKESGRTNIEALVTVTDI